MGLSEKPDYSNWISKRIPRVAGISGCVFILLSVLCTFIQHKTAGILLTTVFVFIALILICFAVYMECARRVLSYEGKGVQGKVLDKVLSYLNWDGQGKLIDIGCGSGAMTIKAAKRFPLAQIVGMDYWGIGWDFSKKQCENNARLERVEKQITFQKGDAANLEFPDGSFDAAVSNFVFHEVRNQPDKLALINEAFRVIKPGGLFVFEDIFFSKKHYGDIEDFVKKLSGSVSEIHFIDTRHCEFIPAFLRTPLVLGEMGLIYGRK